MPQYGPRVFGGQTSRAGPYEFGFTRALKQITPSRLIGERDEFGKFRQIVSDRFRMGMECRRVEPLWIIGFRKNGYPLYTRCAIEAAF